MASKAEQKRQQKVAARKQREREQKKQRHETRQARREAGNEVSPSAPMWRRAGHWLDTLKHMPPALANDEVLMLLCKVSLLLRGMYKVKPTSEVAVALTVIDSLGTGLSGAKIPEAWDLVSEETVQKDAENGADDKGPDPAEDSDSADSALRRAKAAIEGIQTDAGLGELGDVDGQDVEPVLDAPLALKDES